MEPKKKEKKNVTRARPPTTTGSGANAKSDLVAWHALVGTPLAAHRYLAVCRVDTSCCSASSSWQAVMVSGGARQYVLCESMLAHLAWRLMSHLGAVQTRRQEVRGQTDRGVGCTGDIEARRRFFSTSCVWEEADVFADRICLWH